MVKTLLPPGCYDVLPPFAGHEAAVASSLMNTFEAYGYAQVAPPLLEYTESLLAGRGATLSPQVFRLMDSSSHKVMGLRADITLQIARIAATRLLNAPLPLRLSYLGPVLRAQGGDGRGGRQLTQAGIELIGPSSAESDAEVIHVAAESLMRLGISECVIDLNMPGMVSLLLTEEKMDNATAEELMQAVAHKDVGAVKEFKLTHGNVLAALLALTGAADDVLRELKSMRLPAALKPQVDTLTRVVERVKPDLPPSIRLTADITESGGLEYHTGVTFSCFAPGAAGEMGGGGRYRIEGPYGSLEATGFTLYTGTLSRLVPLPGAKKRVLVAGTVESSALRALQQQGFVTLHALPDFGNTREDAKNLGCTHYFSHGSLEEV